jgi:hypothetical protein
MGRAVRDGAFANQHLAAKEGEARVDAALGCLLETGEPGEGKLNAAAVRLLAGNVFASVTRIDIADVSLSGFDKLLCGTGVVQ